MCTRSLRARWPTHPSVLEREGKEERRKKSVDKINNVYVFLSWGEAMVKHRREQNNWLLCNILYINIYIYIRELCACVCLYINIYIHIHTLSLSFVRDFFSFFPAILFLFLFFLALCLCNPICSLCFIYLFIYFFGGSLLGWAQQKTDHKEG